VCLEYKLKPSEVARTWSLSEVHETYYHIRLRDLREPKGMI
jgi:hypothetical protein